MRKSTQRLLLLFLVIAAALFWFRPDLLFKRKAALDSRRLYTEVSRLIRENYVDPVQPEQAFAGAYNSIMRELDRYSAYISPAYQKSDRSLQQGKGFWAGLWLRPVNRHFEVVRIDPDSPAGKVPLKRGDRIESINGINLTRLTFHAAKLLLYASDPGEFTFSIVTQDERESRTIAIPAMALTPRREPRLLKKNVAYISLSWLDGDSVQVLSRMLPLLKNHAWIVDLRGYQSGNLAACLAMADLLLPPTDQLELRTRMGTQRLHPGTSKPEPLRIAALVDPSTIMYGEILATLMKAAGVLLVGSSTGGYNAHLRRFPLPDGGIALITDGSFFWKRKKIGRVAVQPNISCTADQDPMTKALLALEGST